MKLGRISNGEIDVVNSKELFASGKSVVLGIPGAFTPVCSLQHVPDFLANAEKLSHAGYHRLVCIAPNDPFVLETWQKIVDPHSKVLFLSDGNLDFCSALHLIEVRTDFFLGRRSKRYLLTIEEGVIRHAKYEADILTYSCTRSDDVFLAD